LPEAKIHTEALPAGAGAEAALALPAMHGFAAVIIVLLGATVATGAAAADPSPEGFWLTADKSGIIEIYRCADDGNLCGRLASFSINPDDPNPQALDLKNPDPAARNRSLCGLIFMQDFKPAGANRWEEGSIYDPESGKTYHATVTLQADGALRLRGYIGISLIGRSEVWTRFTQKVPSCPTR
jgi:uncharacterized protein (DUF2147 family)